MKTLTIFVAFFTLLLVGCKENVVSITQTQDGFETWANSITADSVRSMYNSAPAFMTDVRFTADIMPFSYQDSVTSVVVDTAFHYPATRSSGLTRVKFYDSLIFKNTWNNEYMSGKIMTVMNVGEVSGYKIFSIYNCSYFPENGSYGTETHVFYVKAGQGQGRLSEIDLLKCYANNGLGAIKKSTREGVIILSSYDYIRMEPKYRHLILYEISSQKYKRFDYPY